MTVGRGSQEHFLQAMHLSALAGASYIKKGVPEGVEKLLLQGPAERMYIACLRGPTKFITFAHTRDLLSIADLAEINLGCIGGMNLNQGLGPIVEGTKFIAYIQEIGTSSSHALQFCGLIISIFDSHLTCHQSRTPV